MSNRNLESKKGNNYSGLCERQEWLGAPAARNRLGDLGGVMFNNEEKVWGCLGAVVVSVVRGKQVTKFV